MSGPSFNNSELMFPDPPDCIFTQSNFTQTDIIHCIIKWLIYLLIVVLLVILLKYGHRQNRQDINQEQNNQKILHRVFSSRHDSPM